MTTIHDEWDKVRPGLQPGAPRGDVQNAIDGFKKVVDRGKIGDEEDLVIALGLIRNGLGEERCGKWFGQLTSLDPAEAATVEKIRELAREIDRLWASMHPPPVPFLLPPGQ